MKEIVKILDGHVDYFQVDDIAELRTLRTVSDAPCLVLGYVLMDDLEELVQLDGILGVFDIAQLERLNDIGMRRDKPVTVHVEIDALLGRLGIVYENAEAFLAMTKNFPYVSVGALYAHFSDIEDSENLEHADLQYKALHEIVEKTGLPYHIAATSGVLADEHNQWGGSIVRIGIGLYGIWPSLRLQHAWEGIIDLRPVLKWKTAVAQVKTLPAGYPIGYGRTYITKAATKIAVIPQGYSDGFDRRFSNNGAVLIRGMRCPVLGRVSMNMFVVDVTEVKEARSEDEVVLLGTQEGEVISAEELADRMHTINYEVLARISPLLDRIVC